MKKCHIDNILTKRLTNRANSHSQRTSAIGLFLAVASCAMATGITLGTHDTYAATSTLSLTIDNSTISIDLPANSTGTFAKSGHTTITAATNNVSGYTLKIAATSSTNYNMLVNSSSTACDNSGSNSHSITGTISSNCFTSIGAATAESTFSDASSTDYNNLWGYLPSKHCAGDVCSANTSFLPAPTPDGDTIDKTTAANTTPNTYTLAIGARVDNSLAVGAYSNTYNVTLVGNAVPYAITYKSGAVSSMPDNVSGTSTSATVNISSTAPTRSGYKFLGWCAGTVSTNDGTDSCSGTTYAAGASYTLDQTGSNTITLTAMWAARLYMWDATSADCGKTMWDNRDDTERSYTTATINGLCWMTTNLALGKSTATALTSDTSNVSSSGYTLPARGTSGTSSSGQYVWGTDSTTCGDNSPCYGYYSYAAATAGTNPSSDAAAFDICPKGWRLPTISELTSLSNSYTTGTALTSSPFLGVYAGGYYNSQFYSGGSYGFYWSSTTYNSDNARYLHFDSSRAFVSDNNKGSMYSIRCVAKQ